MKGGRGGRGERKVREGGLGQGERLRAGQEKRGKIYFIVG